MEDLTKTEKLQYLMDLWAYTTYSLDSDDKYRRHVDFPSFNATLAIWISIRYTDPLCLFIPKLLPFSLLSERTSSAGTSFSVLQNPCPYS